MEEVVIQWEKLGMLMPVQAHKLIFVETKDIVETSLALDSFKKACDSGRGGKWSLDVGVSGAVYLRIK